MTNPLRWHLSVDWDGDGNLEGQEGGGVLGDNRLTDYRLRRGRQRMMEPGAEGTIKKMPYGEATITLSNDDDKYNPYNSGSSLYPNVLPNRDAVLHVEEIDIDNTLVDDNGDTLVDDNGNTLCGSTLYVRFTGTTDEPVLYKRNGVEVADIKLLGAGKRLYDREAHTAVGTTALPATYSAITLMGDILDAVDWPSDKRDLGSFNAGKGDFWWSSRKAIDELHDLVINDAGYYAVRANGDFWFRGYHQITGDSPLATLTQDQLLKDMAFGRRVDNIRNRVKVEERTFTKQATAVVWTLATTPKVAAGETETLIATTSNPVINHIDPVATTDYTMNTASDGSGTDLTSDFNVTMTAYAMRIELALENTSGSDGYVTKQQARGDEITQDDGNVVGEASDTTSQAAYGERVLKIATNWAQYSSSYFSQANYIAGLYLAQHKDPHPSPVVKIEGRPSVQFAYDLGDRLALNIAAKSLNDEFRLARIEERPTQPGNLQTIRTVWGFERAYD